MLRARSVSRDIGGAWDEALRHVLRRAGTTGRPRQEGQGLGRVALPWGGAIIHSITAGKSSEQGRGRKTLIPFFIPAKLRYFRKTSRVLGHYVFFAGPSLLLQFAWQFGARNPSKGAAGPIKRDLRAERGPVQYWACFSRAGFEGPRG